MEPIFILKCLVYEKDGGTQYTKKLKNKIDSGIQYLRGEECGV